MRIFNNFSLARITPAPGWRREGLFLLFFLSTGVIVNDVIKPSAANVEAWY
jgi:hypothetical protein